MKSITFEESAEAVRDGRSARWDQHREERRVALVRAARAAVHELGPQASMDEIATHSGTSKSVYYRYFGDRAGLRRAVAERVTARLERRLREAAVPTQDAAGALHRMVEAYLSVAASSPHVYAFAVAAPDGDVSETAPVLTPFLERVYALLAAGLARHLPPGVATATTALWPRAAVGLIRGSAETWLREPAEARPSPAELADTLTAWLLDGVRGAVLPAGAHAAPSPSPTPAAETAPTRTGDRP